MLISLLSLKLALSSVLACKVRNESVTSLLILQGTWLRGVQLKVVDQLVIVYDVALLLECLDV